QPAQLFHRAADALLRGVFVRAERRADSSEVTLLEETQQDSPAIGVVKFVYSFVKDRCDFIPGRIAGVQQHVHIDSLSFTFLTTTLAAHEGRGDKAGVPVQPAAEHRFATQGSGFARQIGEYGLDNVLREMRVAAQTPKRHRVNQIDVTGNQFAEGRVGAPFSVI